MKRHLMIVGLLLLAPVFVAAEEPAPQADSAELELLEPAIQSPIVEQQPDVPEAQLFEAIKVPTVCAHPEPSANFCDRYDSSYCNYEWDCQCCCTAVWAASGANCGSICI